ncbi:MAG: hypothetical protein GF364_13425 [Candidatus Lokiarchaeota archaeon]|nr:hypothetical protein [Candidatus Lokiarchaeota archaeon]
MNDKRKINVHVNYSDKGTYISFFTSKEDQDVIKDFLSLFDVNLNESGKIFTTNDEYGILNFIREYDKYRNKVDIPRNKIRAYQRSQCLELDSFETFIIELSRYSSQFLRDRQKVKLSFRIMTLFRNHPNLTFTPKQIVQILDTKDRLDNIIKHLQRFVRQNRLYRIKTIFGTPEELIEYKIHLEELKKIKKQKKKRHSRIYRGGRQKVIIDALETLLWPTIQEILYYIKDQNIDTKEISRSYIDTYLNRLNKVKQAVTKGYYEDPISPGNNQIRFHLSDLSETIIIKPVLDIRVENNENIELLFNNDSLIIEKEVFNSDERKIFENDKILIYRLFSNNYFCFLKQIEELVGIFAFSINESDEIYIRFPNQREFEYEKIVELLRDLDLINEDIGFVNIKVRIIEDYDE